MVPVEDYTYERNKQKVIAFKGLVALAHERWGQEGFSLEVELIEKPHEMNGMTAITQASLTCPLGNFADIGDANPENVGRNIAPHFIRMAATRAMGRVLRIALNVSAVSAEELVDEMESHSALPEPQPRRPRETREAPSNGHPPPVEGFSTPGEDRELIPEYERPVLTAQMRVLGQLVDKNARLTRSDPQTAPQRFEENRAEKKVREMTYGEANEWIERLVEENESLEEQRG
jgi:hypothetical protein